MATERIDAQERRIMPGTDQVVTSYGCLLGTCMTRVPSGATAMDARNETPRCKELFAGL